MPRGMEERFLVSKQRRAWELRDTENIGGGMSDLHEKDDESWDTVRKCHVTHLSGILYVVGF